MNKYPVIAVLAADWSMYTEQVDYDEDFKLLTVWIVGLLISEDKHKLVIAHEFFPKGKDVRYTSVISKVSIIKRIDLREINMDLY